MIGIAAVCLFGCSGISGTIAAYDPLPPLPAAVAHEPPVHDCDDGYCQAPPNTMPPPPEPPFEAWVQSRERALRARFGLPEVTTEIRDCHPDVAYGHFYRPKHDGERALIVVYTMDYDGDRLTANQLHYVWSHEYLHAIDWCAGKPEEYEPHAEVFEARMHVLGLWP